MSQGTENMGAPPSYESVAAGQPGNFQKTDFNQPTAPPFSQPPNQSPYPQQPYSQQPYPQQQYNYPEQYPPQPYPPQGNNYYGTTPGGMNQSQFGVGPQGQYNYPVVPVIAPSIGTQGTVIVNGRVVQMTPEYMQARRKRQLCIFICCAVVMVVVFIIVVSSIMH